MKFEPLTRFARGFVYAYNGIRAAIREERNFRFHLCAAFYAFLAAFWAELAPVEVALVAAKDMAAGAVLVMALGTLVVAVCLLVPHFGTLWANFTLRPTRPAGIVLTLVIFTKFIFRSSNSTEKGKQPNGKTDS